MLDKAPVFAIVPCVDLERAANFYGEVLGLERAPMPGSEEQPWAMVFACGQGTRLLVYLREMPTKADHTAAGWLVDDVNAVVDRLLAHGVTMEVYDMPGAEFDERGVATSGDIKSAWFKDTEGNILSVSESP